MRGVRCFNTVLILASISICLQLFSALQRGNVTNPEQFFLIRKQLSEANNALQTDQIAHRNIVDMREKRLNITMAGNSSHVHVLQKEKVGRGPNGTLGNLRTLTENVQDLKAKVAGASGRCFKNVQIWCKNAAELGFSHGVHDIECPGSVCDVKLSIDRSFETMQKNEALILYHWTAWDWKDMYAHRPPGQKWVFYTLESPRHTRKHVVPPEQYYNTTYDYIMSFRYDSDFRADYGQYIEGQPELDPSDVRNWAENKTKVVAWMASNCKGTSWERRQFVTDLKRYLPVDTYGKCGNNKCPPGSKECDEKLAQYKFYLALENSECTDYITEKFWIQSYKRGLVPIVYGPPRSDYEKVAPPNSFIHIQDFRTLREMADYIKHIDANDTLYNAFFEWKTKGSLKPYGGTNIMCQLGDRLVRDERIVANGGTVRPKQMDWKKWWTDSCRRRGEIPT